MPISKLSLLPLLILTLCLLSFSARSQFLDHTSTSDGPCPALSAGASSCPIRCFRADPVCGADGVTYWCGCPDAACAGVGVVHTGPCKAGSSSAGLVPREALLLIHITWLFVLGFSFLFGLL
ncbi:putative Kazal domain-containing protein [Dioscorea sansibarensis]